MTLATQGNDNEEDEEKYRIKALMKMAKTKDSSQLNPAPYRPMQLDEEFDEEFDPYLEVINDSMSDIDRVDEYDYGWGRNHLRDTMPHNEDNGRYMEIQSRVKAEL